MTQGYIFQKNVFKYDTENKKPARLSAQWQKYLLHSYDENLSLLELVEYKVYLNVVTYFDIAHKRYCQSRIMYGLCMIRTGLYVKM